MEFVVDEIGLAVGISRVAASNRLDLAQDLTGALPAVLESLQTASIDLIRARIIAEGTEPSTGTCVPPSPSSTWPPATSTPTRTSRTDRLRTDPHLHGPPDGWRCQLAAPTHRPRLRRADRRRPHPLHPTQSNPPTPSF
ncbi:MAG: hypothetical protein ACR2JG_03335 [Geodermatophilaceae bacterium]